MIVANNFDGLRLVLSLMVLWGHQDHRLSWLGSAAVLAFFVVSGALVSKSWLDDPNVYRFLTRRFLRVWPALAVVVLVSSAGAYALASGPWESMEELAATVYLRNLYLHGIDWSFFPGRPAGMNGSLWMLPYEVDLYFALAAVGLLFRFLLFPVAFAAFFFSLLFPSPVVAHSTDLFFAWSLCFAGFFGAGVLLGNHRHLLKSWLFALWFCLGLVGLATAQYEAAQWFLIPTVVMWIGCKKWGFLASLNRFGDLSYGVYLWAWPVQQVTRLWLSPSHPIWLQLLLVIPQVLAIAYLSWHLVEKKALSLKPQCH